MKVWIAFVLLTGSLAAAVEDGAALFSAQAVKAANQELAKIRKKTGKEILFLTLNDLGEKKTNEYIRDEAYKRKLNGVLILIAKNPRQLEVTAGRKTSMVFNYGHRQKVVEILKKGLGKTPDLVLAESVKYMSSIFMTASEMLLEADLHNAPPQAATQPGEPQSSGWLRWFIVIAAAIVVTVAVLIIYLRRRQS